MFLINNALSSAEPAIFAIAFILSAGCGDPVMPTRNINLTSEQDAFISEMIEAGEYHLAAR